MYAVRLNNRDLEHLEHYLFRISFATSMYRVAVKQMPESNTKIMDLKTFICKMCWGCFLYLSGIA